MKLLRVTLRLHRYVILEATDGEEAMEVAVRENPDLIIMDMQLPKMSGLEATRRLRQMPAFAHIPIVAVTAYAMKGDRERCMAAGMDDYLTKPVRAADLRAALTRWLAPGKIRRQDKPTIVHSGERQVLDLAMLMEMKKEMGDRFAPLVNLFLKTLHSRLASLQHAVTDRDPESLARIARQLKGSSRQYGAIWFSEIAEKLELLGRSGTVQGAEKALLPDLEAQAVQLEKALVEEIQST